MLRNSAVTFFALFFVLAVSTFAETPNSLASSLSNSTKTSHLVSNDYFRESFLPITDTLQPNGFSLAAKGETAPLHYSAGDAAVVRIAAQALCEDIERVTGLRPSLSTAVPAENSEPILVGTLGQSSLIDALVSAGKIDASAIKGQWESYLAAVVDDPLPGIKRALVIAGSDRRGTAFGIFGLSETIGVSPWHWWGDVPTRRKASLHVGGGLHIQASPRVKYRGIFLNDEDWGLQPWAAKTFEPELGNIGPKTYAAIFELMLRLHANVIWPAMHEFPVETTPFYLNPDNKLVADDYAIVISTSHHEPMLRNSHEYNEHILGPYNYWTNRTAIYDFWAQRVAETARYENIYTMGLRGRTDAGMLAPAGTTDAQKAEKIQNEIIPDQRQMISNHVNPNPEKVPQIFIPYKETLVQYQSGLKLPDDVTIVWPDDNHGYIRQLSNQAERGRSGGSGIYYHLSYWGVPRSYLWFCTTPPGMTRAELMKAWDFDARRIWIVNVGDIKPHEIGMEFFLRVARNPETFRDFDQGAYLSQWAARNFGKEHAAAIAALLQEYYRLNIVTRPEHLDSKASGFDFVGAKGLGDEASSRLEQFASLSASADALYAQLPSDAKAAFYQMVLFPLRASHLANKKVLLAERSRLWAAQERAATAMLAAEAQAAEKALNEELAYYNRVNAEGKWNHMMEPQPLSTLPKWARETQSPFYTITVGTYAPPSIAGLGVAIEGSGSKLVADTPRSLPVFDRVSNRSHFVDIFNTGTAAFAWTATPSEPWIRLSQSRGTADARIQVNIDWSAAPYGNAIPGSIIIEGADSSRTLDVKVINPPELADATLPDAVESNGMILIEAENFDAHQDSSSGTGWRRVPQATVSGDGVAIQPVTAESIAPSALDSDTPSLTYQFHCVSSGEAQITLRCLPTHRITSCHPGLRYAISLNGDTPTVVNVHANEYTPEWRANVLRAYSVGVSRHTVATAGLQTIKIQMIDPGVVLDQIIVQIKDASE